MSVNNGGSAFPNKASACGGSSLDGNGMSLRDYFAAKAFTAIIGTLNGPVTCEEREGDFGYYANCAYQMADALLRARNES